MSALAATAAGAEAGAGPAPDWRLGGFGIYLHWPFCLAKCPYCDFNSHVWRTVDQDAWAEAIAADLVRAREATGPREAGTVFFGGGTPSLMPPATVARLIEEIDRLWGLAPGAEITLEANPTSSEALKFRDYAGAGVNRLSMGIQALDDAALAALGRTHSAAEALAAFDAARATMERVSFDLIYARMGQTPAEWEAELARALELAVDHLSLYQLTLEPGTRFTELHARGRLTLPDDGLAAEMYRVTQGLAEAHGMPAYEISNHARPGAESRHNLVYWRYGDYAGVGPGAHGRITGPDGARRATEAVRDPAAWLAGGAGRTASEPLTAAEQATEYLLMAMRLAEGADPGRYAALAGAALPEARIATLEAAGLVDRGGRGLRATPRGRLLLNRILTDLLA